MQHRLHVAFAVAALLLGACSSPDNVSAELPAEFADGVPAPTGEVVLSITTGDAVVDWDMATLQQLPQTELTILEPFIDEERTFRGPAFTDVLRASGVDVETPGEIELVALDDFRATVPTDLTRMSGVMVAALDGDAPITIEEGGPIRLIFPEENDVGDNLNSWIWSMRSGTVR